MTRVDGTRSGGFKTAIRGRRQDSRGVGPDPAGPLSRMIRVPSVNGECDDSGI